MSITLLTQAVFDLLPDTGLVTWLNSEPGEAEMPPWIIATCTTDTHQTTEAGRYANHTLLVEIRVVHLTVDAVNIICDDKIIPTLQYRHPLASGYSTGMLTLIEDSGTYAAGLTADDTARRFQVRVLRYRLPYTHQ